MEFNHIVYHFVDLDKMVEKGDKEMITKLYIGKYEVVCDNCGDGFESETWQDVMERMRNNDWKKKLIDREWNHFCNECAEVQA